MLIPANSTIKTGKDFNGKTLGAAGLNTLAEYLPRAWIDKHGGDSTTGKFVEVCSQSSRRARCRTHRRLCITEPFITIAEDKHGEVADDRRRRNRNPVYVDRLVHDFAMGAHRTGRALRWRNSPRPAVWANKNPDKVVPIVAKYLKSDPALTA